MWIGVRANDWTAERVIIASNAAGRVQQSYASKIATMREIIRPRGDLLFGIIAFTVHLRYDRELIIRIPLGM